MNIGDEPELWCGRATRETVTAIERMFASVGEPKSRAMLEWLYLESPGGAFVAIAHDKRGPVEGAGAVYAAFSSQFRVGETSRRWIQSFDTLTLPEYRGRGLFVRLARMVFDMAVDNGVAGVYGFPNDASLPGFVRRLGWTTMDPLPMVVRPIGARYLRVKAGIRRPRVSEKSDALVGGSVKCVAECPKDVDLLYREWSAGGYVGVQRDFDYLNWRLARPGAVYSMYTRRSSDGTLEGFGASSLQLKHGCALGYVMELMCLPEAPGAGRDVAHAILRDLKLRHADLVLGWSLPCNIARSQLRRVGFIGFKPALRPISLHFAARVFDGAISATVLERDNWYLSYLDSDTV
jgi:GNAT superfamily N-acetyltransferase